MENELWEYFKTQHPEMSRDVIEWIELGIYELYVHLKGDIHLIYDPEEDIFINIGRNTEFTDIVKNYRFRIALVQKVRDTGTNYARLSRQTRIDKSSMYKYRDGKLLPNNKVIEKMSQAFKCSPNEFYEI